MLMRKIITFLTLLTLLFTTAWAETATLTYKTLGLPTTLTNNTPTTIDGITYVSTDLKKDATNTIYAKGYSGTICNTTAYPGNIVNVAITHSGTARATTIWGSYDGNEWTEVATGNGSFEGDFSGKGYSYFKITRGQSTAYWTKIVITYTTGGSGDVNEYVDLALPSGTLWATRNIGASTPEEYGQYFAWGETTPKADYDWDTYQWSGDRWNTMTKYCTSSTYGTVDNKTELDLLDDAASVNWGPQWRMPSKEQQAELRTHCNWQWTTQNGMKGYRVTSQHNGKSLFLPAAGYHFGTELYSADKYCYYWSRSLDTDQSNQANDLWFYWNSETSSGVASGSNARCDGYVVRPVRCDIQSQSISLDNLEHGENPGQLGSVYTISDQLIAVKCMKVDDDIYLWCKDQVTSSVAYENEDPEIYEDYMRVHGGFTGEWDQSNWIALKFENAELNDIVEYENKFILANTLIGVYTDNTNYTLTMLSDKLETGQQSITIPPNLYCPANFLQSNLYGNATGHSDNTTDKHYFFVNPKIQEVCKVTFAVWDGTSFVVPQPNENQNDSNIPGAVGVDWSYNGGSIPEGLEVGTVYKFDAIVQRPVTTGQSSSILKETNNYTPDGSYKVYPIEFDPTDENNIVPTSIVNVLISSDVVSVKYYNPSGIESDTPFKGVNIVVTRYSDGSTTTTKILK